jgi:ferredoxin
MEEVIINIKDREGVLHILQAPTDMGFNLMEIMKSYELPVEGTCGGMALCASCHVYVHSEADLSQPSDDELNMLDEAFFVKYNSRLGCQLKINEKLHNIEVELAPVSL